MASAAVSNAAAPAAPPPRLRYIDAQTAAQIDEALMSQDDDDGSGFSIDQLMELAGLACAQTVYTCYPPSTSPNVLVAAGPGNQGGDGLVAARHLCQFGYRVLLWYPKEGKTELFQRLKRQLKGTRVEFVATDEFEDALQEADVVLDTIFGFSFKGEPREPFKAPLQLLYDESRMEFEARRKRPPVVSVDIPSGWDVDAGNPDGRFFTPQVILSLTAPKNGIKAYTMPNNNGATPGRHFLGGRFVPEDIEDRFNLALPDYPADAQIVEVTGLQELTLAEAQRRMADDAAQTARTLERTVLESRGAAPE